MHPIVTRVLPGFAALLVVGCSVPGVGYVGTGPLPLAVLSVTMVDPETQNVSYKANLKWDGAPGAKTYEIIRKFADQPAKVLTSSDQTSYVDATVGAKQPFTYRVRALSGENKELTVSKEESLAVLGQEVGKPEGLLPADNASISVGEVPTLKWNAVPNANWYYVRVTRVDQNSLVYSALTKSTEIKFGDASPLKFDKFADQFPVESKSSITAGIIYRWNVQAVRGDGPTEPSQVKAVDLNPSANSRFSQGS